MSQPSAGDVERAQKIINQVIDKHRAEHRELYGVASAEFQRDLANAIAAALAVRGEK